MISTIDILRANNQGTLATITFSTDSYRRWAVMGDHFVELKFSLPQVENGLELGFLEIPVGSYIEFKGRRYTLYNPSDFTKNGLRNYEYTLKLYAYQELLYDCIFINEPDGMTVFPRTARPEEFLTAVVRNMNKFDTDNWAGTEWTVGDCITSNVQQTVQFNGSTCMQALQDIATAFKTEWEVNNKVISLKKVEYNKTAPLKLWYSGQYGADANGGGFVQGLGRGNYDESRPVHKLYVKGGDRNIDFSTYGSQYLLLPKSTTIRFDGTYFEDEPGYDSSIARQYTTSSDGTYLTRTGLPQTSRREAHIELQEAYPKFIGTVSQVIWKNGETGTERTSYADALADAGGDGSKVFCDMFDTSIPNDLNFANMRIGGEQLIVVPQTGRLSGREIGVQQSENNASDGYIHAERRFRLITDADYGRFIPDDRLAVGDTYAVFGIDFYKATTGQQVYIANGERDLLKEAVRYKYENEEQRFTFNGTLDGLWVKRNYGALDDKIVAGGYINFSDPQFHPDGTLIRISAIKEFLFEPEKPELELTNIVHGGGLRGELAEIPQQEVIINNNDRELRRLEQRRWRDIEELRNNLGDVFTEFTEAINPVSVQSMQYIAGNKMGQFRFVTSLTSNTTATGAPLINYNATANTVQVSGSTTGSVSYIQHQTLGITGIDGKSSTGTNGTAIRPASEYRSWSIPSATSAVLDKSKFYWVYARVAKSGNTGTYLIETTARTAFEDASYYYLVVGGLNSEYEGTRGWSPLFGFTEILPGQITTGIVRSTDGQTYFDLESGIIAGRIRFISTDGTLHDVSSLEAEIDSKIETWSQTTNPANNWGTAAIRASHTGDIWYNPSTQLIQRYNGSSWVNMATPIPNVETGNTVFTSQPYPPYKIGDLWTDGTFLRRCLQTRTSGGYVSSDWPLATNYDHTQTAINGGIISTGRLEVGNGNLGTALAGITGEGTASNSVRIWAGNTFSNRNSARFRVQQDGSLFANNATLEGNITATSGKIGAFNIIGGSLSNNFATGDGYIIFRHDPFGIFAGIGADITPQGIGVSVASRFENGSNQYARNAAIYCRSTGTVNNNAIYIAAGSVAGFAIETRQITTSTTLLHSDVYITCYNTSNITVTLPPLTSEYKGKVYYIKRMNNATVTLSGSLHTNAPVSSVQVGAGRGDTSIVVSDGQYWCHNYMIP